MKKAVWFDLENAPHVWILKELIHELRKKKFPVIITARNFSATVDLCKFLKIDAKIIGDGSAKKISGKLFKIIKRSILLYFYIRKQKIKLGLAISHGSRSQILASYLLRIHSLVLDDYEHSYLGFYRFAKHILSPFAIPKSGWGKYENKVIHYPGLKEELYLWNNDNLIADLKNIINKNKTNIVFRPQGRFTHYKNKKSELLQKLLITRFQNIKNIHIILFPRDKEQEKIICKTFKKYKISFIVPEKAINGPALINSVEYVIGGGGTMTREASVLGIPSFTFFGGQLGGVDNYLIKNEKLIILNNESQVNNLEFKKQPKNKMTTGISKDTFNFVLNYCLNELK